MQKMFTAGTLGQAGGVRNLTAPAGYATRPASALFTPPSRPRPSFLCRTASVDRRRVGDWRSAFDDWRRLATGYQAESGGSAAEVVGTKEPGALCLANSPSPTLLGPIGCDLVDLNRGDQAGRAREVGHMGAADIELADAVAAVRDELLSAAARGVGQEVEFVVGPIELEFAVELRKEAKAKAGFKAWVVSGDVEAGASRTERHRVTVSLTPRRPGGADLLVSGARTDGPGDVSEHIGR